ncbi:MAG: ABC transporter permease [Actinobacteria bacterium]|nr:MAG: ABC transporter permease [Actinomycetota bacterium]REK37912.1 MAG: ABC transporter permease [Actinomycetota bacterium]
MTDTKPAAREATRTSELRHRLRKHVPAAVLFVLGLVAWEGLIRAFDVESFVLPAPSEIGSRLVDQWSVIMSAAGNTMIEVIGGLTAGVVLGVTVALISVRWEAAREGILPFAIATNAMPIIALAPIANNMFPVTSPVSKMTVVAIVVFFPVMINTVRGLTEVGTGELELMRSFAATPRELFTKVRIPSALPYFFSALKVASTLSIIAAIVAEYFGGPQDVLGQYIIAKANLFVFPDAWAAILVASAIGIAFYGIILGAERLVMSWHVSLRATEAG